jgi:hypothetical protein
VPPLQQQRDRTVRLLCDGFAHDHLELADFETRLDAANRARTATELAALVQGKLAETEQRITELRSLGETLRGVLDRLEWGKLARPDRLCRLERAGSVGQSRIGQIVSSSFARL